MISRQFVYFLKAKFSFLPSSIEILTFSCFRFIHPVYPIRVIVCACVCTSDKRFFAKRIHVEFRPCIELFTNHNFYPQIETSCDSRSISSRQFPDTQRKRHLKQNKKKVTHLKLHSFKNVTYLIRRIQGKIKEESLYSPSLC